MNFCASDARIISSAELTTELPESRYRAYEFEVSDLVGKRADIGRIHWDRVTDCFCDGIPAREAAEREIKQQIMARHFEQGRRRIAA